MTAGIGKSGLFFVSGDEDDFWLTVLLLNMKISFIVLSISVLSASNLVFVWPDPAEEVDLTIRLFAEDSLCSLLTFERGEKVETLGNSLFFRTCPLASIVVVELRDC